MKRLSLLLVIAATSLQVSSAQASGVILESIKAHLENRPQPRVVEPERTRPRSTPANPRNVAPHQDLLERWFSAWQLILPTSAPASRSEDQGTTDRAS